MRCLEHPCIVTLVWECTATLGAVSGQGDKATHQQIFDFGTSCTVCNTRECEVVCLTWCRHMHAVLSPFPVLHFTTDDLARMAVAWLSAPLLLHASCRLLVQHTCHMPAWQDKPRLGTAAPRHTAADASAIQCMLIHAIEGAWLHEAVQAVPQQQVSHMAPTPLFLASARLHCAQPVAEARSRHPSKVNSRLYCGPFQAPSLTGTHKAIKPCAMCDPHTPFCDPRDI
jgi:hypothetical protein